MEIKIFFKIIYYSLVFLIILVALFTYLVVARLPFGLKLYVTQSGSMFPAIQEGSLNLNKPSNNYSVGEIITYKSYEELAEDNPLVTITHRIVDIIQDDKGISYRTKGDRNQEPDMNLVSANQIIGKVIFTLPYVGWAINFGRTQWGFTALVVIPATIIIYNEILTIKQEIKTITKKKKNIS